MNALSGEVGRIIKVVERLRRFQVAIEQQPVPVPEVGPVPQFNHTRRLAKRDQRGRFGGRPATAVAHAVDAEPEAGVRSRRLRRALHRATHQHLAGVVVRGKGVGAARLGRLSAERAEHQRERQQPGQQGAASGSEQRGSQHAGEREQGQRRKRGLPARTYQHARREGGGKQGQLHRSTVSLPLSETLTRNLLSRCRGDPGAVMFVPIAGEDVVRVHSALQAQKLSEARICPHQLVAGGEAVVGQKVAPAK